MNTKDQCSNCKARELQQLRSDLAECKKKSQSKDKKIKALDKKVFIFTLIAIAIGAVFGKEALDAITEWLGSINRFRVNADGFSSLIFPSPSTASLFIIALIGPRRRRKR
tara:strand:- start:983 stop:1312 length:330 start_codon:yes stop_codon:yes gene_type:complete